MSKLEWSTTATDNDDADGNINWAEGQLPSTVNNSARAMMAAEASHLQGIGGALTTGGTGSAYTLTLADAPTAYTTSICFLVKFHAVSTSATATININALGAKTLKLWDGSALPSTSYIPANAYGFIKYDGTDMRLFLPSKAADLSLQNVFTNSQLDVHGGSAAVFILKNLGGSTDKKIFRIANASDLYHLQSRNDDSSALSTFITMVPTGAVKFPSVGTTASGANAVLNNADSNSLLRFTSSLRYKYDVTPVDRNRISEILQIPGIRYRSTASADNPDWTWYGFAAEAVAAVDPRLVHWGYSPEDYEYDEDGSARLKDGATLKPDGVMYERFVVMHQEIIRNQQAEIDDLKARIAALEAA